VIGGGPSGLAVATTLAEKGYDVCIIERNEELGGLLDQCIHDGFGTKLYNKVLSGPEFTEKFIEKLNNLKIEKYLDSFVKTVEIHGSEKKILTITPRGIKTITAKSIVYAIGCRERNHYEIKIGGTRPSGIFTAGYVQRLINLYGILPGKNVIIVGGGDVGMIVARHLYLEGVKNILMVYPEKFFIGLSRNVQQCIIDFNIPFKTQTIVKRIMGKEKIKAIEIVNVDNKWNPIPGTEKILQCDCLILSVGLIPYAEKLEEIEVKINNKTHGPEINECFETSIDGIFAIGNLVQIFDYVDDAVETAFIAAKGVEQYLKNQKTKLKPLLFKPGKNIQCFTPQRINKVLDEITIFFRSNITLNKAQILFKNSKDEIIHKINKPFIRPSTLEQIKLPLNLIKNEEEVVIDVQGKNM